MANAVELMQESRLLRDTAAIPRAYSLAVLAAEEFGKCQLAIGTVGGTRSDSAYWKDWWKTFYGHGPKLVRAIDSAMFLPAELKSKFRELLEAATKERRREMGFYVDFRTGGAISPHEAIDREEVAEAIACLEKSSTPTQARSRKRD